MKYLINEQNYKLETTKNSLEHFFMVRFLDLDKKYYKEICDFWDHYKDLEE